MVTRVYLSRTDEMLGSKASNAPQDDSFSYAFEIQEGMSGRLREGGREGGRIVLQDS